MHASPFTRRFILAGLLAAALGLGGCASSTTSAPPASVAPPSAPASASPASSSGSAAPAASGMAVTIKGFAFDPASLIVPVGASVTWTNQDPAGHTVTADDGSFGSPTIQTGSTFSQTFAKAGTFSYHCSIHPSMKATVVVQ
ncbi:MAG TPA: cupredoxin family copper-binding protein [Candidatus Limnocylindrales bacterium]